MFNGIMMNEKNDGCERAFLLVVSAVDNAKIRQDILFGLSTVLNFWIRTEHRHLEYGVSMSYHKIRNRMYSLPVSSQSALGGCK